MARVFPPLTLSVDPLSQIRRRNFSFAERLQRALKAAITQAEVPDQVNVHTLRHGLATHLLQLETDIRTLEKLLGQSDVSTTMIYAHVLKIAIGTAPSPSAAPNLLPNLEN